VPVLGERRVDEITVEDVNEVVAALASAGKKRETIKKSVKYLAAVLDEQGLEENPARSRPCRSCPWRACLGPRRRAARSGVDKRGQVQVFCPASVLPTRSTEREHRRMLHW
jgi:hypothetical protein